MKKYQHELDKIQQKQAHEGSQERVVGTPLKHPGKLLEVAVVALVSHRAWRSCPDTRQALEVWDDTMAKLEAVVRQYGEVELEEAFRELQNDNDDWEKKRGL